jgi:hypothetical protein
MYRICARGAAKATRKKTRFASAWRVSYSLPLQTLYDPRRNETLGAKKKSPPSIVTKLSKPND